MGTSRKPHSLRLKRGDLVRVIAGADRGKEGRVLRVVLKDSKVVVEKVNLVHRHVRRSQKHPQGGRVQREAPIHISNVMVVDPDTHAPTKVGRRQEDPARGSLGWVRFSRKTGTTLDGGAGKPAKPAKKGKKAKE